MEIVLSTNQELLQQNQKLQEENRRLRIQLYSTQSINRKLSNENDNLRNRDGLMLKKQQEKQEEKIANVQARKSELIRLVDMSNVRAVEKAEKERDTAIRMVAEEKQKASVSDRKAKAEIVKVKRHAKQMITEAENKINFWKIAAAAALVSGFVIGWRL